MSAVPPPEPGSPSAGGSAHPAAERGGPAWQPVREPVQRFDEGSAVAAPVLPPAGWYLDPWRLAPLRWWDGRTWTPHVQGWPGVPPAPRRSGLHPAVLAGLAVTIVLVLVAGISLAVGLRDACDPDDARCDNRVLLTDALWEVPEGEQLVIRYEINPENAFLDEDAVVGAVQAAVRTWEAADPAVRFAYDGTTDAPAGVEDGRTVIGTGTVDEEAVAYEESFYDDDGYVVEADVVLSDDVRWVWEQCAQRDGACDTYADGSQEVQDALERGEAVAEAQSVLTHELGHVLSLGHPERSLSTTMSTEWDNLALYPQTLALGDVLGVRELYPCGDCGGAPRVYVP